MRVRLVLPALVTLLGAAPALAQPAPSGPVAVGVVRARQEPIIQSNQFVGRIQAQGRVNVVARVTAFLEKRFFKEGAEVKAGQLLYQLEQGPFQADVQAKQAAVAQAEAQLKNATLTLQRAQALLHTPAGQQSTVDAALATQQTDAAQVLAAQANLKTAQINLGYTRITSPIDGKIGVSNVTVGNVVGPSTGTLATIVSQDPMYVVFPVALPTALELRDRYAQNGGYKPVVIRLKLPDGRTYNQTGKLDFAGVSVTQTTDTILLRGVIANPILPNMSPGQPGDRELIDGEFVTVLLQAATPITALAIPRSAVLSDQKGDYVYTVDAQDKVAQQRVQLGQSTPDTAVVMAGLKPGQMVIVDGLQTVRPGMKVQPGPAAPGPGINPNPAGIPEANLTAPQPGNAMTTVRPPATGVVPSPGAPPPGSPLGGAAASGGAPATAAGGTPATGTGKAGGGVAATVPGGAARQAVVNGTYAKGHTTPASPDHQ